MFINLKNNELVVTFHYAQERVAAIRTVPGRYYHAARRRWCVPVEHAEACVEILQPLGFTATMEVKELVKRKKAEREKRERMKYDPPAVIPFSSPLPLFPFQRQGAAFVASGAASLLADVPGLGKTIQTMAALTDMSRILVFAPASVKYGWEEEIHKWTPNASVRVIDGTPEERGKGWCGKEQWVISNYELLLRDLEFMTAQVWDAVVCDEATRIANPHSKTARFLRAIPCRRRVALTGTPVSNSPLDLYAIIDWLSPRYFGSYTQFKERYCIVEPVWGKVVGFRNLGELADKVEHFTFRRTKEEVMKDLPPKTTEIVSFEISQGERKLYTDIQRQIADEMAKLDINPQTLSLFAVKMLRLKQVVDHPALLGSWESSSKEEVLKDILEPIVKSGERALVFTQFAQMAHLLVAHLAEIGYRTGLICGETETALRMYEIEKLNGGEYDVLVMTEAGTYGLNLQGASYVVHYDAPWSVAKLEQREDRAHRIGQTKPVIIYHLIARNTIDEYVAKVLHKKQAASVEILKDKERLEAAGIDADDIREILRI